jgi:TonB family protein
LIRVLLLAACLVFIVNTLQAQTASDSGASTDAFKIRIERSRALVAAHQLQTAASELESVRASAADYAVRNIASVMLMSIYLEEGNYGRAEALLEENFKARAVHNGDSLRTYFALAGQAVNGARNHLARYRSLGINTTDSGLPNEARTDLDRLRSFLERMIVHANEISNEQKAFDSLSLLEDVLGIRVSLAKDIEDQGKWQVEYAGARQLLASQTQVASLGTSPTKVRLSRTSSSNRKAETKASESQDSPSEQQHTTKTPGTTSSTSAPEALEPRSAGSLSSRAVKRVVPEYPVPAKEAGAAGLVRVHVVVDQSGNVIEISRSEGPILLRRAAEDAARQWCFEPVYAETETTRLSGYIDFNFTL